MKKILLIASLALIAIVGCKSLEPQVKNTTALKSELYQLEKYNSDLKNKIDSYKNRVQELKTDISQTENSIDSIKTLAGKYVTVKTFSNEIPKEVIYQKEYPGELPSQLTYVFVRGLKINLRERPTTLSKIVSNAEYFDKLTLLEEVINRSGQKWCKVLDKNGEEVFVYSKIVEKRVFRFDEMLYKLNEMEAFISGELEAGGKIASIKAYVPNPNNEDLKREQDKYGNVEDQSAAAIYEEGLLYIPDRTIVSVLSSDDEMSEIKTHYASEEPLFVTNDLISYSPKIDKTPIRAVVVDTQNQNLGVFQKINNKWTLISYNYSKTGAEKQLGFKTPKGFFTAANTLKTMLYKDEVGEKQGYANNAIRFSGGGYIHATPFNYDTEVEEQRHWKEYSLGTYRGTRKCVRNDVEHSEFLFNWVLDGKINNSNFQSIRNNTVVIVM